MQVSFPSPQKPAPPAPPPDWSKEPGKVQFLTDKTWDSFMADHSSVLVMMFAPCKWEPELFSIFLIPAFSCHVSFVLSFPRYPISFRSLNSFFSLCHYTIHNSTLSSIPVHSISSDSSSPFFSGCGYCQSMKPNYFKAAEILSEENVSGSSTLFHCGKFPLFSLAFLFGKDHRYFHVLLVVCNFPGYQLSLTPSS